MIDTRNRSAFYTRRSRMQNRYFSKCFNDGEIYHLEKENHNGIRTVLVLSMKKA